MTTPPAPLAVSPVPVHVTGVSEDLDLGLPKPDNRQCVAVPRTVILTSDEPAKQLLRPDPDLEEALVFVFTNQVVLSRSKGDAQAAGNTAATITNPNGALLPTGILIPLKTTSELWVSTGTYPTLVSVVAIYKR